MDLSTLANLINAFAGTAGVTFAAVQIRYYRQQRRREAMLELVKSFQSPAFTSALRRVLSLQMAPMQRRSVNSSDGTGEADATGPGAHRASGIEQEIAARCSLVGAG